ncbi:MAG TPA: HD-GYP domain-containing protein [Candidatus Limnocylindrales bacterium]|nr:HD-GYP domain-containing protein [Candidatus Limnocylindrales bacterium]
MDISTSRPESNRFDGDRLPAGRREAFKLKALRDFTLCFSRARDFDESLNLALMVILGTYSIAKGALFLEEEGEFRVCVSRGLPPGIPPIEASKELLATLRRSVQPVRMGRPAVSGAIRQAVAGIERAVPAFSVAVLCPLGTRNGTPGLLALGPTITGEALTQRQRETLSVMTSLLSSHVSNHRVLSDIFRLNEVLQIQVRENDRLLGGMQEIYFDTIRALATAIEAKDPYTRGHSERVAKISVSIAKRLELPDKDVQAIRIASILHDVGKIGTARSILLKPSPLNAEEVLEIRRHPQTSYEILSEIRFPYPDVALLARDHHEWLDGTGYPGGKREGQIPMGARIIALADAFDAMVSDRPYRDSLPLLVALGEIRSCLRRHYDPNVGRMFFRSLRTELVGDPREAPVFTGLEKHNSRADTLAFLDGALSDLN